MPHAIITPNIRTTRAEAHYVRAVRLCLLFLAKPIATAATAAAGLVIRNQRTRGAVTDRCVAGGLRVTPTILQRRRNTATVAPRWTVIAVAAVAQATASNRNSRHDDVITLCWTLDSLKQTNRPEIEVNNKLLLYCFLQ